MPENNLLKAALYYASRLRWSVIPLAPGLKIPPKGFEVLPYRERIANRQEIEKWWRENPRYNVGIITGRLSGILAVDHDMYKQEYDAEEALKYIPDDIFTPTAETPRGGQHQIFAFPDKPITIGAALIPGLDYRGEGGYIVAPPSMNGNGCGYKWIINPDEAKPARMPGALLSALNNNKVPYKGVVTPAGQMFAHGRRDNDLFHTALTLVKGGMPDDEIFQVLANLIKSWGESPDPKWIFAKIESAKKRSDRRETSLAQDVREWVLSSNGVFLSSEVDVCRHLSSREDRKNISKILSRLCNEGLIEKYGNRNGQFRRVNNELEPLDWLHADTTPLPLQWPFGIERLVNLYPGNLAVIAGAPNAGKTAFILNFIRLNQDRHDIHLFTSEGGKEELKLRLDKVGLPLTAWRFSAWDRSGDWADVIRPDAINIVDFLELHDDFYKVGGILKSISDKLKSGFALVALQKNPGRDEGLGGTRSLEKPRLYLAMDHGRTKIVKAKSWVDGSMNPNGMSITWKLIDGCKFMNVTSWGNER